MERHNKNWGRCYISKKRLSFVNKLLIILGLVLLAIITIGKIVRRKVFYGLL